MAIWIKKRLVWSVCGIATVLMFGTAATHLKAQGAAPKTPEEAAKLFEALLNSPREISGRVSLSSNLPSQVISTQNLRLLGEGVAPLLLELQKSARYSGFKAKAPRVEGNDMVVDVTPSQAPPTYPVVVVKEGNGYRIDLVKTYARSLKLGEGEYQKRIFELTAVALPGLPGADSEGVHSVVCKRQLKELGEALKLYTEDYDGVYPPSANWMDVLEPYVAKKETFHCPDVPGQGGYAFNENLSTKAQADLKSGSVTTAIYETEELQRNASGLGEKLAFRHKATSTGPSHGYAVATNGQIIFVRPGNKLDLIPKPRVPRMRH